MTQKRRRFLQGIAATGALGVAGCLGGVTDDGGDSSWPPARNMVEVMVDTDPGGLIDVLSRHWLNSVEEEWPDDVTGTVSNRPEAQGIIMANELQNGPTDGGQMGGQRINSLMTNYIGAEQANYELMDWEPLAIMSSDTRALQFNPRTTPVEDHFELEWSDFQNLAEDQGLAFPYSNAAQQMFANYVRENDPVLNEDNWELIEVSGGSEARAAMERGDLDGYFGSYVSNYSARNDAYYTQFVFVDSESSFYEGIADTEPETAPTVDDPAAKTLRENDQGLILNNDGGFAEDNARTAIELVNDSHMLLLPPGTPDEIIQTHEDAFGSAAESDELAEAVSNSFAPEDHNPAVGDEVRDVVQSKYESMYEDEGVRTMIQDQLF